MHCVLQKRVFLTLIFKKTSLLILSWCLHPKTHQLSLTGSLLSWPSPICLELSNFLIILWPFGDYICWCLKLVSEAMCAALHRLPVFSPYFLLWLLGIMIRKAIWLLSWSAASALHLCQHPHLSFNSLRSAVVLKCHPLLTARTQLTPLAATWDILPQLWITHY